MLSHVVIASLGAVVCNRLQHTTERSRRLNLVSLLPMCSESFSQFATLLLCFYDDDQPVPAVRLLHNFSTQPVLSGT